MAEPNGKFILFVLFATPDRSAWQTRWIALKDFLALGRDCLSDEDWLCVHGADEVPVLYTGHEDADRIIERTLAHSVAGLLRNPARSGTSTFKPTDVN